MSTSIREEQQEPVAVKIKLMRLGKIREPYYRIVVADARTRRSGRAIETIGKYHPKREPSLIELDSARVQYWLGVGAQPTDPVQHILEITGDWQKFKGLPGAEGTLRHPEPPADRLARFQAALAVAGGEPAGEATTPKRRPAARKPKAEASAEPAAVVKAESAAAGEPAADDAAEPAAPELAPTTAEPTKAEPTKQAAKKAPGKKAPVKKEETESSATPDASDGSDEKAGDAAGDDAAAGPDAAPAEAEAASGA